MIVNFNKHKIFRNLKTSFKDNRGIITSLTNLGCKNVSFIVSKKKTIRANHYHKTDWHFIYILKGSFNYYYKKVKSKKIFKIKVNKGDLLFTPPKLVHATHHTKKTEMIVISKKLRDSKNYEKDLVRVNLININNIRLI